MLLKRQMFQCRKTFAGFGKPKARPTRAPSDHHAKAIWRECQSCACVHKIEEAARFRVLLEDICCSIGESSQAICDAVKLGDPGAAWNVEPEKPLFKLTQADGTAHFARYGVIGSYTQNTHSWLWAWGFPEGWMPQPALQIAKQCHDHCATQGWAPGTERTLLVNPHEAWHLTKLAAHIAGLPMVYRTPVNDANYHYFAIDRPVLSA